MRRNAFFLPQDFDRRKEEEEEEWRAVVGKTRARHNDIHGDRISGDLKAGGLRNGIPT